MLHGGAREQPHRPARFAHPPYSGTYRSVRAGKKGMFVSGSGSWRGGGRARPWFAGLGAAGPRTSGVCARER